MIVRTTLALLAGVMLSGCAAEAPPAAVDSASTPAAAAAADAESGEFRMTVSDVFTIVGRGVVVTGTIAQGKVAVGDSVCLTSAAGATRAVTVNGIELFRKVVDSAGAGEQVGLSIAGVEQADVTRGDQMRGPC